MYTLLVFDWDGTLMDSEARIVACVQAAAADLGIPVPDARAAREIIGLGLQQAVARLFAEESPATHERIATRYREHFLVLNRTRSRLFPGVEETLAALRDAGHLMAVATGKSRRGLERELDETGLRPLFHASRCADETFSKPHPRMLEEVMLELGAAAEDTLVIGDTEYDMQMAANAGAAALGVGYGVHSTDRLLAHGALDTIASIADLLQWLAPAPLTTAGNP